MPNPDCRLLPWDSAFFGKRIGRIAPGIVVDRHQMDEIEAWSRSQRIDCLYYLCPSDNPRAVRVAEDHGFRLVDIRVELSAPLPASAPTRLPAAIGHLIRPSAAEDLEWLISLAGRAFGNTRFSNDPEFGPDAAPRLYRRWIKQNCGSQTATVLVCIIDNRIAGFVSLEKPLGDTASISLIAVEDGMRGRGVGRALVEAGKDHCRNAGHRELRVVTQASNSAALRLYEETGFRLSSVRLWYHKWFTAHDFTKPTLNMNEAKRIDDRA
jgi:ribosomal protein S18 acetylase RimI-like enzyme